MTHDADNNALGFAAHPAFSRPYVPHTSGPEVQLLQPETELERRMLMHPAFLEGLHWGVPRFGHPEGKVLYHIREVLDNIDRLLLTAHTRRQLRIIAFAHDTFKYKEDKGTPRDWTKHHGIYARKFLEDIEVSSKEVLEVTEWHDEAYFCWRMIHLFKQTEEGHARLQQLLHRIAGFDQLFYLFFKCDTQTGDKNQAPLRWFEQNVPGIEVVVLPSRRSLI